MSCHVRSGSSGRLRAQRHQGEEAHLERVVARAGIGEIDRDRRGGFAQRPGDGPLDRLEERVANTDDAGRSGHHPGLGLPIDGVRQAGEPTLERDHEAVRLGDQVGQSAPQPLGGGAMLGHEAVGALGGRSVRRTRPVGRRRGRAGSRAHRAVSCSAPWSAIDRDHVEAIGGAELGLARLGRRDIASLGGGQQGAILVDDPPAGPEEPPVRLGHLALDPQPMADVDRLQVAHRQLGGHAPAVVLEERPAHQLVEERGQDAAVRLVGPADQVRAKRDLGPGQARRGVDGRPQAAFVELAADEAVMRVDDEPVDAPVVGDLRYARGRGRNLASARRLPILRLGASTRCPAHEGLRCQGWRPCGPRP